MSHIGCNCKTPNYNPIGRCLSCGGFHEGTNSAPTIDDMNEAIAIFDGWEFIPGDPKHKCKFCFAGDEPCTPAIDRFVKDGRTVFHFQLKYNTSWDVLMPIGKKIRDLLSDMLSKRPPHTACTGDIIEVDITCALHEYDIVKVHAAIYAFIQWYNQHKQTTTNEQ